MDGPNGKDPITYDNLMHVHQHTDRFNRHYPRLFSYHTDSITTKQSPDNTHRLKHPTNSGKKRTASWFPTLVGSSAEFLSTRHQSGLFIDPRSSTITDGTDEACILQPQQHSVR